MEDAGERRGHGQDRQRQRQAGSSPGRNPQVHDDAGHGFTASRPVKGLRPLRDPDAVDLDDDDDGQEE
ncbi:hypothetical protein GCM10017673_29560 [Streptosporangium violaceochromogenes]|nr:hypothetical protein GCM10017673_29560 [Streptosporangium violaceochromogenes]